MPPGPATPLISYVVATYNCAPLVGALAATAQRLRGSPVEICVSDGGSTDGTAQALQGLPGLRLVRSSPDVGIYDAWNRALPFVRGRYVGFLGIDDEPGLSFISAAVAHLEAGGACADGPALIYGDIQMHRRGRVRRVAAPAPAQLRLFAREGAVFDLQHPGCLTRADLFAGEQSFDASFQLAGDFDFYLRAAQRVRAGGLLRLPELQAKVRDDGLSRRPQAWATYAAEHARIAQRSGQRLGHANTVFPLLAWLARRPRLYEWCKDLSWALRGRREPPPSPDAIGLQRTPGL